MNILDGKIFEPFFSHTNVFFFCTFRKISADMSYFNTKRVLAQICYTGHWQSPGSTDGSKRALRLPRIYKARLEIGWNARQRQYPLPPSSRGSSWTKALRSVLAKLKADYQTHLRGLLPSTTSSPLSGRKLSEVYLSHRFYRRAEPTA